MLKRFIQWLESRTLYVLADPRDNSITLSRGLYRHIRRSITDRADVFVFRANGSGCYGFTINPPFDTPTVFGTIQYNSRHKCVGFESLCPTVNRIAYDYGLSCDSPSKLAVKKHTTPAGQVCYLIPKPRHAKSPQP